jgi:ribosomal protein S21
MRYRTEDLLHVRRRDGESLGALIARFCRMYKAVGLYGETKARQHFIPRSEKRRAAVREGIRRARSKGR